MSYHLEPMRSESRLKTHPHALLFLLLLGCPGPGPSDSGDLPSGDPLELALWQVEQVDPQLAADLAALPRVSDGVDEAELTALEALATAVELVADEAPRAVALLRSLPAAGFVDAVQAPAVDGLDDDWADAPRVSKATGRVAAQVDILEVAAQVAGDQLHLMIPVDGELSDRLTAGVSVDELEAMLFERWWAESL